VAGRLVVRRIPDLNPSKKDGHLHRVYDSTTCPQYSTNWYRTKAVHTGWHGGEATTTKYSEGLDIYCPFSIIG